MPQLPTEDLCSTRCKSSVSSNRARTVSCTVPGVTEPDAADPSPAAVGPHDALPYAGQVVRRVLLRRNIVIDAETAQLVAAAVQAALQTGTPSRWTGRGPRFPPLAASRCPDTGSYPVVQSCRNARSCCRPVAACRAASRSTSAPGRDPSPRQLAALITPGSCAVPGREAAEPRPTRAAARRLLPSPVG